VQPESIFDDLNVWFLAQESLRWPPYEIFQNKPSQETPDDKEQEQHMAADYTYIYT